MAPPKTDNPDRKERLLDAATQLMLGKGYVATTVDEICASADVTKGSFFYYFESKQALGKVLVERFSASHMQGMESGEWSTSDDPLDRVYGYIDFVITMSKDPSIKGCLIGTFAQELSESHPEIKALCSSSFAQTAEMLREHLAAAKARHAPKASFDVASLAESYVAIVQGAMILMKAKDDRGVLARSLEHYKQYLRSLFGR